MDKDKTPTPNLSEEVSKKNAATPQNQRGISQSAGKAKMKSENFSPEGDRKLDFDRERWQEIQDQRQMEIDNRLEKEAARQSHSASGRKGFSFKVPKFLGWAGAAATIYEVGSKIYEAYKESKDNENPDKLENEVEEPTGLMDKPTDDKTDIPAPKNEEEKAEPLSRNDEGVQNPTENLAGNDIVPEGNSADRLTALFRGDNQEPEKDAMPDVQDRTEDLQPEQNDNPDLGKADRLAALFRGDNQEPEEDAMPDVQDKADRLTALFRGDNQEPEKDAMPDVQDKADRLAALFRGDNQEPEKDAMPDVQDKADRLAALFRGDNQEPEKDAMPDVQDKIEDLKPEQNDNAAPGNADRLAALFRGDNQELENNELPEISDERKEAIYLAFNEGRGDAETEDYFPVDKSVTEDFANDHGNDEDMDVDMGVPDIGDAGGDD